MLIDLFDNIEQQIIQTLKIFETKLLVFIVFVYYCNHIRYAD